MTTLTAQLLNLYSVRLMAQWLTIGLVLAIVAGCGGGGGSGADGGGGKPKGWVTVESSSVVTAADGGGDSYNLYWSYSPGFTRDSGTRISGVESPYTHTGLLNGVTYHYVISTNHDGGESDLSSVIAAVAGTPEQPSNVTATAAGADIIFAWDNVYTATTYNLYRSNISGQAQSGGTAIYGVTNPHVHMSLAGGRPDYYTVTAKNGLGKCLRSVEVTATPKVLQ